MYPNCGEAKWNAKLSLRDNNLDSLHFRKKVKETQVGEAHSNPMSTEKALKIPWQV